MPTIRVQGTNLTYEEKDILRFDEGLIGMPQLRRMVLLHYSEIAPLLLLCSLEQPDVTFLVLDANAHFPMYTPRFSANLPTQLGLAEGEAPVILTTVTIAPEWTESTVNLRAPLVIAPTTMRGAQVVLTDSRYELAEPLPTLEQAAAK
ncbi:MAG TPA: flagellar assembly protein FliW [Blastocatellia bacterium]|nr:flagellar assembly protein FliW [Blastocatellia bacterium]